MGLTSQKFQIISLILSLRLGPNPGGKVGLTSFLTRPSRNKASQTSLRLKTLFFLLILLSGDVATNPGPRNTSIYPCGYCERPVTWSLNNDGVCCDGDGCDIWYHKSCIELCSADFRLLNRSSVQWFCCKCEHLNLSSFTFHSFYSDITNNFYYPIQDSNISLDSLKSPDPSLGSKNCNPLKTSTPIRDNYKDQSQGSPKSLSPDSNLSSSSKNSPPDFSKPIKENLRILNLNCRGIRGKKSEFNSILDYTKPDIVCGVESFLTGIKPGEAPDSNAISSSEIFPPQYNVYRNDRNAEGGGVFVLIHKSLVSVEKPEFTTNCEIIWAKIHLKGCKEIFIGCFYMPHRNMSDLDSLEMSLDTLNKYGRRHIILCGDFNCPNIDWTINEVLPSAPDRPIQEKLIDISVGHGLTQLQEQATRYDNILDLHFSSNPSLIKASTLLPGISDHDAVIIDSIIRPNYIKSKKRKILQFKKANWDQLKKDCDGISASIKTRYDAGDCVVQLWDHFKTTLNKTIGSNIPSKMIHNNNNLPWINKDLKKMIRKKTKLHRQAKKSKEWSKFLHYQKTCKKAFRRAEWDHVNKTIIEELSENNTKPFWRYIKAKKTDNLGVSPLKNKGRLHSESKLKAEILLQQFSSVFTKPTTVPMPPVNVNITENILPIEVTTKGVEKLLSNIKPHKAHGPDNIPNLVLNKCATSLAPGVALLFQRSLDSGKLPKDWTDANVSPIFKKGDRHTASNYRPVSLTSVLSKTLEHIVCHAMHEHFDHHKVLTNLNHGFRSGYSCETQLTITIDELSKNLDKGLQTDVAFLDFSKAFDTVPHDKLLHKLEAYGIRGSLHTWIKAFLCDRKMRVIVEGEASEETTVDSGVPQGTVLGPLLFLCHINDLPDRVTSSVRLFADDCLLYRPVHNEKDHQALQDDLKQLEQWASDWGMRFNATKCYILSINSKISYYYELNNTILKQVNNNPYLGLLISKDLKWATHINSVAKKASSTIGFLRRNISKCPEKCRRTAYIALVRSTLEYGSTVWDPHLQKDIDKLEQIQRRAARFITGNYKSSQPGSMSKMLKDLNLPPLQDRRRENRLCFLYKISKGLVPAIPPSHYLTPSKPKRKIKAKSFDHCETKNFVQRHQNLHDNCFDLPITKTTTYKKSFFPKTISEWNQLKDTQVSSKSLDTFRSSLHSM